MRNVDLKSCIEELVHYTLTSFINGTLKSDLGLSKSYCSDLLLNDSNESTASADSSSGDFVGVPAYPLYKRLAAALYESVTSGVLYSVGKKGILYQVDHEVNQKENEWGLLVSDSGSALLNALSRVNFEMHVQEPYFSYLRDGLKVVEGRCARGDYNRIGPGDNLLLNQCVMLEVLDVHRYGSFSDMLVCEGLSRVLPGVGTIEEGVQVYRRFYTEMDEKSSGVLAIQVQKPVNQPFDFVATILSGLSYAGIQHLLGLTHTVGTISEALPPPRSVLVSSFMLPCHPNVTGCTLSIGARALAKHANRDTSNYWGTSNGNDSNKNQQALNVISKMMSHCCWLNIHITPPHGEVFEIRAADGYGARWTKDGTQTTGSLYFWAAHLAGPKWGPFASWCCAWLETIGLIAGIGTQAYAGSQTLQSIILLCTGTNKGGGYLAPKWLFLCMYMSLTLIWAVLNTFALEVIALIDIVSIWWQIVGGSVMIIMLPMVALTTKSASYVFTNFETAPDSTGISSKPYAVVMSLLVSQYSLYGYDAAAHLTEETKGADKNGPIAILSSIGIISVFGWAYILTLTFCIQDFAYLYDTGNETAGAFVPAQILYDAFYGRYQSSAGAIVLLCIIWGSFFFGGLSITTSAARVVYALSRDKGVPFSSIWRKIHPKHKVPSNAVWLCAAICILLGLPILKVNVVFTAITSICTIGWVGGYAVPIFARMVMSEKNFKHGPFYLGRGSRPICLVAFLWICYTCSVFLLPTYYPIDWDTFNYAPVALGIGLGLIMVWWIVDARKWFKGPVRNFEVGQSGQV